jgi:hypothetical protein
MILRISPAAEPGGAHATFPRRVRLQLLWPCGAGRDVQSDRCAGIAEVANYGASQGGREPRCLVWNQLTTRRLRRPLRMLIGIAVAPVSPIRAKGRFGSIVLKSRRKLDIGPIQVISLRLKVVIRLFITVDGVFDNQYFSANSATEFFNTIGRKRPPGCGYQALDLTTSGGPHAIHIHGDPADEIVRRKPMGGGQQAGERTGGARKIGSPVKLWKPVIS